MKNVTGSGDRGRALSSSVWALALCIFAGLFGRALVVAQTADQAGQIVKSLSSNSRAVVGRLAGKPYPGDALTEAWKKITFNGFHDLAAGSGIGIFYKEAQQDYDQVRWATNEISQQSLKTLSAAINTQAGSGVPVLVLNPLAWERSGPVTVDVQLPASATGGVSVLDAANRVVPSQVLKSDAWTNSYTLLIAVNNVPSLGVE